MSSDSILVDSCRTSSPLAKSSTPPLDVDKWSRVVQQRLQNDRPSAGPPATAQEKKQFRHWDPGARISRSRVIVYRGTSSCTPPEFKVKKWVYPVLTIITLVALAALGLGLTAQFGPFALPSPATFALFAMGGTCSLAVITLGIMIQRARSDS